MPLKIFKTVSKINLQTYIKKLLKTLLKKSGDNQTLNSRPNLLSETLLTKTKELIVGSLLAGTVILRRMVIAIGIGVVKSNDPGKAFASFRSKL